MIEGKHNFAKKKKTWIREKEKRYKKEKDLKAPTLDENL